MQLRPMEPEEAVEQYLASRKHDTTQSTQQNHRYRLTRFLEWCEEVGFEDMNDLTGRKAEQYKNYRITEGGINQMTLQNQLRTFRMFVRWCEANEAVEPDVSEKILIPTVSKSEQARDEHVDTETAEEIIEYLSRFEWASLTHIVFHTLWHTGARRGALRALDVSDWHSEERYLAVRHRPESDTPLKLKEEGERNVTITNDLLTEALDDYIQHNRHEVEDDYGRDPLLTTTHGRPTVGSIQRRVYKVTRPCFYAGECPHNRDIDDCEGTEYDGYSKCPSSLSPHPVRRGAITEHLNENVPKEVASERMSVSVDVLDQHYDARSKEEKRQNREQFLNGL
jgi:site-specific recombinase XerD